MAAEQRDAKLLLPYLRAFSPDAHSMFIPGETARVGERRGWLRWVPPILGCAWQITDEGLALREDARFGAEPEQKDEKR